MRKILSLLLFVCFLSARGQELPPKPSTLVTDNVGILSGEEAAALEQKLVYYNDSTSTQFSILIIHSTGVYDINDYAQKVGQAWGIGQQGKNNGALILVSYDDHKVSIQTGYGLEGAIPDALAKRIIEQDIKPYFKQKQYYQGLDQATTNMIGLVKGEFTADQYVKKGKQGTPGFMIFVVIFIVILVLFFKARGVRSYASSNNIPFWVAWGLMNSASRRGGGFWNDFSGGGGGFGGGGSSGGGGFGGFGGGSFGGGGASGSW